MNPNFPDGLLAPAPGSAVRLGPARARVHFKHAARGKFCGPVRFWASKTVPFDFFDCRQDRSNCRISRKERLTEGTRTMPQSHHDSDQ